MLKGRKNDKIRRSRKLKQNRTRDINFFSSESTYPDMKVTFILCHFSNHKMAVLTWTREKVYWSTHLSYVTQSSSDTPNRTPRREHFNNELT